MKCSIGFKALGLVTVVLFAMAAIAQEGSTGRASQEQLVPRSPQAGNFFVPDSSKEVPAGFAHTNYVLASVDGKKPSAMSTPAPKSIVSPSVGDDALVLEQLYETPNSMGCLYAKSPATAGCIPFAVAGGPTAAGYGAIAIVDAFDNPDAASDVATFNAEWPLLATSFTKVYANGNGDCSVPPPDGGWALEESLDIEWAHVFAPNAAIVLVEACSNSYTDLFYAEQVAFEYIATNYPTTGGQVTNSWQGGEFSGQNADDILFTDYHYVGGQGWKPSILAFASSGDGGYEGATTGYPSGNPWLISAGGTSVYRKETNAYFYSEGCWAGSGGGVSAEEKWQSPPSITNGMGPWTNFQYQIFYEGNRVTPDLSFNADPASGVYVYSGYNGGWYAVGGTSVSSPSLASFINRSNNRLGSITLNAITGNNGFFVNQEDALLYGQLGTYTAYKANFYDVVSGSNGGPKVGKGYDECTGVGTPRGLFGK